MVRFLHTADLQLGMTRAFLSTEAQARFTQARISAIETMGIAAKKADAEFIVVSGDVFDAPWVEPQTIIRAVDAFRNVSLPVYLLPGNHDPYDAASVYRHPAFADHRPGNVTVLTEPGPHLVKPGVEILAAPWLSKRPTVNPAQPALAKAGLAQAVTRILVAHGGMDTLAGPTEDALQLRQHELEAAIQKGIVHYVALGDRHSATRVDAAGRIWYSGAPEPTAYVEDNQRKALLVDVTPEACKVDEIEVGTWRFVREKQVLSGDADLPAFKAWVDALPAKPTTTLRLGIQATLTLRGRAALENLLDQARALLGGLETWQDENRVVVQPDQEDLDALKLSGFAASALDELKAKSAAGGTDTVVAQDAIGLLWRLTQGGPA